MRQETEILNIGFAIIAIALLAQTLLATPHAAATFGFDNVRMAALPGDAATMVDPYVSPDNIGLF